MCLGDTIIYLQRAGGIKQTVTIPADGSYRLSFAFAARPNFAGHTVQVFLGDRKLAEVGTIVSRWTQFDSVFQAKAGTYEFMLWGVDPGADKATVIDAVSIKPMRQPVWGNLLANPGFETESTFADGWKYFQTETSVGYNQKSYATTSAWTPAGDAGLMRAGDTTWGGYSHTGQIALFLQRDGSVSQTINVPADGTYRVSFYASSRGDDRNTDYQYNADHAGHTVQAQLDGETVAEVVTWGRNWEFCEAEFTATAGTHTFTLQGVRDPGGKDASSVVDDVVVASAAVLDDGAARYDTLTHALQYGPEGLAAMTIDVDADLEQSLDLDGFAGTVTVQNTTTATVLAFPSTLPTATVALNSPVTLKLALDSVANTAPVLNAVTALPADGTLTLAVSFSANAEKGTYVLADGPLAADLASRLDLSVAGGVGRLELDGSRLTFVVQSLEYMLWRGSGADTWSSNSWLLNGAGDPIAFVAGLSAFFDGGDSAQTLWVNENVSARELDFTGGSYSIAGSGLITAPKVEKDGGGTLTMAGAGFNGVTAFNVNQGRMTLGPDATAQALGAAGGTVTVKNGAQFDINYELPENSPGDSVAGKARSLLTHDTTFVIEGAGPDGKGALVNGFEGSNWGAQFGKVVLTGDATIGSVGRIDFRPTVGATSYVRSSLTGPADATLTVKTSEPTGEMGLNIVETDVNVGRIDVPEGGTIVFENGVATEIPNGIHLLGGRLGFWGSGAPGVHADVFVGQDSSTFGSGTSRLYGAFVVPENVVHTHETGDLYLADGIVTNNGIIRVTGGVFDIRATNYVGGADSSIVLEAGDVRVFPYDVEGQVTFRQQAGTSHFNNWADWSKVQLSISMDAGTIYWGSGDSTPPAVDFNKISFHTEGGSVIFDTMEPYVIPSAFKDTAFATASVRGVGAEDVYTMGDFAWNITELQLSAADRYGFLDLEQGAELTTARLRMGAAFSPPQSSRLTVKEGASLAVSEYARIGEWSGTTTSKTHDLVIDGGTFTAPLDVAVGYDSPFAYFSIKDGVAEVSGILPRARLDYLPNYNQATLTHEELTRQTGGLLKVGGGGLKDLGTPGDKVIAHVEHNLPNYNFQSGTLEPTDAWSTGFGAQIVFGTRPTAADEAPYTIDTPYDVTLQTGLAGAADVTLKGAGQVKSMADLQGIPTGKWTLESSADLRGASGFAGGLTLAEGKTAVVGNASTNLVEFGMFALQTRELAANDFWNGRFPMLNTGMELLHNWRLNGERQYHTYAYQGEFYVAPDQAGLWSFAGNFDDEIYLEVDGREVLFETQWTNVAKGSTNLTVGWHTFKAYGFDGMSEAGPQYRQKEWNSTTMGLGFRVGSEGGDASSDYVRFDPSTLPIRPNSYLRIRRATGLTSETYLTNEAWDEDRVTYVQPSRLQAVNATRIACQGSTCSTGSFYVEPDLAGTWTFTGCCDDNVCLKIDGQQILATADWQDVQTGSAELTAGWHALEIRTHDGTGGWLGRDGVVDVNGESYILKVQLPGMVSADEAVAFKNPRFRFAPTPDGSDVRPGLGGVTTIKADAILANAGTAPYPIYGTLAGSGYLDGDFRFEGDASRLAVAGNGASSKVDVVKFLSAGSTAFAGLGGVKAVFDEKPTSPRFVLSESPMGLTADRAAELAVEVKDAAGNDYSDQFVVRLQAGAVVLVNNKPFGFHLIIR